MNATDECPDGESCSIHNRVSGRRERDYDMQYVDYYEKYAVVTSYNPAAGNSDLTLMLASYGMLKIPDPYDTNILAVGVKCIGEAVDISYRLSYGPEALVLWTQGYKGMDEAKSGHDMVLDALKAGIIDLGAKASE